MEKFLHNVNELPTSARSAVESLMGHPLHNDQQLFIVAFDSAAEPTNDERRAAGKELQQILAVMHENVRQSGRSAEEIEILIDQACDSVRCGSCATSIS